jgi:hypothetical protein
MSKVVTTAVIALAVLAIAGYAYTTGAIDLSHLFGTADQLKLSVIAYDKAGNQVQIPSGFTIVNGAQGIASIAFQASLANNGTMPASVVLSTASPSQLSSAFSVPTSVITIGPNASYTWTSVAIDPAVLAGPTPGNSVTFSLTAAVTYTCPSNTECKLDNGTRIVNGQSATVFKTGSVTYNLLYDQASGSTSLTFGGSTSSSSATTTTTVPTTTTTSTTTTTLPPCTQLFTNNGGGNFIRQTCPASYPSCAVYQYASCGTLSGGTYRVSCAPSGECYYNAGSSACLVFYGLGTTGQSCP